MSACHAAARPSRAAPVEVPASPSGWATAPAEVWRPGAADGRVVLLAAESGGLWLLQPEADGGAGALRWVGPERPFRPTPPADDPARAGHGRVIGACGDAAFMLTLDRDTVVASAFSPPTAAEAPPSRRELSRAPAIGPLSGGAVGCASGGGASEPVHLIVGLPGAAGGAGEVHGWSTDAAPRALLRGTAPGTLLGAGVVAGHDLDGDGVADLAASAWGANNQAGAIWLQDGPLPEAPPARPDRRWTGEVEGDVAGFALTFAGDTDLDGYPELLVGAHGADHRGWSAGAAYLIDPRGRGPLSGALAVFLGAHQNDRAGWAVAAGGDVDGDGRDDLVIGAPGHDGGGPEAGAVYLENGSQRGIYVLSTPQATRQGPGRQAQLGEVVALLPAGGGVAFGRARRAPEGSPPTPTVARLQLEATPRR